MADAHVAHPLGPPTVSGTNITVDTMLNQPSRITRMISDLTLQKFLLDKIFSNGGKLEGGSVIYDEAAENEIYTDRDVERVEAGAEFPIITSERSEPKIATADKWGGKVYITDEARTRNNSSLLTNQIRQLANTLVRKQNALAISALTTSIAASGQTDTGNDWSIVVTDGTSATTAQERPMADFVNAQVNADIQELGVIYDLFLLNPTDYANLASIYGNELKPMFSDMGIAYDVSNRVTSGTMLAVASKQVGEYKIEKPLTTETWRTPENQRNWIQTDVIPVFYVTNPFAVLEITGLAG